MNDRQEHPESVHQVVFRWQGNTDGGRTGIAPVAYSCERDRAWLLYEELSTLLRVDGGPDRRSLVRTTVSTGEVVLIHRRPGAEPGGRATTDCHALVGSRTQLASLPSIALAISEWPLPAAGGTGLDPVTMDWLQARWRAAGEKIQSRMPTLAPQLTEVVAAVLRAPTNRLSVRDGMLDDPAHHNMAPALLWGLHEIFGRRFAPDLTFATYDTTDDNGLRFVFVPEWRARATDDPRLSRITLYTDGAAVRSEPDGATEPAEALVRHYLRELREAGTGKALAALVKKVDWNPAAPAEEQWEDLSDRLGLSPGRQPQFPPPGTPGYEPMHQFPGYEPTHGPFDHDPGYEPMHGLPGYEPTHEAPGYPPPETPPSFPADPTPPLRRAPAEEPVHRPVHYPSEAPGRPSAEPRSANPRFPHGPQPDPQPANPPLVPFTEDEHETEPETGALPHAHVPIVAAPLIALDLPTGFRIWSWLPNALSQSRAARRDLGRKNYYAVREDFLEAVAATPPQNPEPLRSRLARLSDSELLELLVQDERTRPKVDLVLQALADRRRHRGRWQARLLSLSLLDERLYLDVVDQPQQASADHVDELVVATTAWLFAWAIRPHARVRGQLDGLRRLLPRPGTPPDPHHRALLRRIALEPHDRRAPDLPPQVWQGLLKALLTEEESALPTPRPTPPPTTDRRGRAATPALDHPQTRPPTISSRGPSHRTPGSGTLFLVLVVAFIVAILGTLAALLL